MKNQFVKFLFIFAAFHLAGLISCNGFEKDDLNCGPFDQRFYEVLDMKLKNFKKDDSSSNIPNDFSPLADSSALSHNKFRLAITLSVEYFTDNSFHFNNPFIQSALACSPPEPEASEKISKIEITSNRDLIDSDGNIISAGTSLNEFLEVEWEHKTLEELVNSGNYRPSHKFGTSAEDIISEILKLNAKPAEDAQPHQFSIVYELDSGKSFSETTPTLFLYL